LPQATARAAPPRATVAIVTVARRRRRDLVMSRGEPLAAKEIGRAASGDTPSFE